MGQILVKSLITSNGRDPVMDANGKMQYKETILMDAARKIIEKQNEKLPTHLKKIIEPYEENKVVKEEKKVIVDEKKDVPPSDDNVKTKGRGKGK